MLKEALAFLKDTFSQADCAELVEIPGDGRTAYVNIGSEIKEYVVKPTTRSHTVSTVADLIAAANTWNLSGMIWVSSAAVVLIVDDDDRRDRVTLPLERSHQFKALSALEKNPKLDQLGFIRLLRIELSGAVGRSDLISAVRKIKWRTAAAGESNIQHGSESLGKTIEAEVTGAGGIPEEVIVNCPVYSNHGEREQSFGVMCDLEIIAAESKFHFKPIADELARVEDAALAGIHSRIGESLGSDVSVFFGSP